MAKVGWILGGVVLLLLILAVIWEYQDHYRLLARPTVSSLPAKEQIREYLFYGCFNSENAVLWRGIFMTTTISTIGIWIVLYALKVKIRWWLVALIFAIIFIPTYTYATFKTFHQARCMCNKLKPDLTIL